MTRGASGRTIVKFTLKDAARQSSRRLRDRQPAAHRARLSRHVERAHDQPARRRQPDAAQPELRAGGQSHPRRVQPERAADVRDARRRQGRSGHARRQPARWRPIKRQVQRFAEPRPGDVTHSLRDVDFRRGSNGEGRVIVDLSDASTGIDIRQQGKTLIVDFVKTSVPRNLERRLDVADFNTPVVTVDTFDQGGNTRMVIEPKGLWEHSAYQTDNRFIIEVKPIQEDPNKLTQGTRGGYKGEKLSLNFQNIDSPRGAAGDRRLHRPQHHHQRHRAGQPDAAPEGRAVGPGARHHPADQGPRHAQERQHRSDRAARGAGAARRSSSSKRRRRSATSSRCRPSSFQLNYAKAERHPQTS